jgi:acetylxylan esterase
MSLRNNGSARTRASQLALLIAMPMAIASFLCSAQASAAGLTGPITGWQKGTEPSWVSMYEYVPANLAANPPILVLVHYCGGNAAGVFGEAQGGGIVAAADKYGFVMVVPQTSQNCWDVATTPSLTHNGGGDTGAIVDQVKYSITKHNANANRVYAAGSSSGAMMTEGLLAVYPDVFKGGSEFAGVPAGCWSVNDPAGQWSGPCAGGQVTHTAAEWGAMVQAMYPGYSGFRPRIQLWHGEADSTISYTNQGEAIKEWTNVLGLSATPASTTSVTISGHQYSREQWQDSCGYTVLDAWSEANGPHGTDANLNAQYAIPFLALDQTGATDPEVAQCGGSAGATGSGGSTAAGGSTASGGSSTTGSGGSSTTGSGGSSTTGSGGGSTTGSGGGSTTGSGGGSTTGSGGSDTNGSAGSGTSTGPGTGSSGSSFGNSGGSDDTGTSDTSAATPSRPGCSCELARSSGAAGRGAFAWAGLLALNLIFGRRRRAKRAADAR